MAEALATTFDGTPAIVPVIPGRAHTTQRVTFDGQVYTLELLWNMSRGSWTLSLFDAENDPIFLGVRIVTNWPLLRWYRYDPRTPPGELVAVTLTSDRAHPGFDDFGEGKRVELTYFAQGV